jgi:hypothetical protein
MIGKSIIWRVGVVAAVVLAATLPSACGGSSSPSGPSGGGGTTPPVATAAIASLTLSPASLTGAGASTGTVTVNPAAGTGGAVVTLSSSSTSVTVPASVTVAQGAASATFTATAAAVSAATTVTISAALGGTQTAQLALSPAGPTLNASFVVTSSSRGSDACAITPGSNGNQIDCEFDARASTGPPTEYRWTYSVGTAQRSHTSGEAQTRPQTGCNFFGGQTPVLVNNVPQYIQMEVRLRVQDSRGNLSSEVVNRNVRFFPNNQCGYGF